MLTTFLAVLTTLLAVRDYLFGGAAYPFDGSYHPRLPAKKAEPCHGQAGSTGFDRCFRGRHLAGSARAGTRETSSASLRRGTGKGTGPLAPRGGVFSYGDARFLGSLATDHRSRQIAGIAATPSGDGYWLASKDGDVFSFGDAKFYGSLGKDDLKHDRGRDSCSARTGEDIGW